MKMCDICHTGVVAFKRCICPNSICWNCQLKRALTCFQSNTRPSCPFCNAPDFTTQAVTVPEGISHVEIQIRDSTPPPTEGTRDDAGHDAGYDADTGHDANTGHDTDTGPETEPETEPEIDYPSDPGSDTSSDTDHEATWNGRRPDQEQTTSGSQSSDFEILE